VCWCFGVLVVWCCGVMDVMCMMNDVVNGSDGKWNRMNI
jgi:hypothetical protein